MSVRPQKPEREGIRPKRKQKTVLTGEEYNARVAATLQKMAKEAMDRALSEEDNGPYLTPGGRLGGGFSYPGYIDPAIAPPGTKLKRAGDPPGVTWVRTNEPFAGADRDGWILVDPAIKPEDYISEADKKKISDIIQEGNQALKEAQAEVDAKPTPLKKPKYGRMIDLEKPLETPLENQLENQEEKKS